MTEENPSAPMSERRPNPEGRAFFDLNISGKDKYAYTLGDDSLEMYSLSPDSQPQSGVPKGELNQFHSVGRIVYPGVARDYSVYVPGQYDPAEPACLIVFQDDALYLGPEVNATTVLDNLIHRRETPVTIAVFVEPGDR